MKIAESAVQFFSERIALEQHQKKESLTVWGPGEERPVVSNNTGGQQREVQDQSSLLSESVKVSLSQQAVRSQPVRADAEPLPADQELIADLNIRILKAMVERLTGKKIDLHKPGQVLKTANGSDGASPESPNTQDNEGGEVPPAGGVIYDYYESHYEYEKTGFTSTGTILTEDGAEIDFSVGLQMSREFFTEQQITIREGEALKDPLVINFNGKAAELSQKQFSFDIDNDGQENQISYLRSGSGFLALDKNDDNKINNGSELFGTKSGDGFKELAVYDVDGNNWIDENDDIYDKLRIWVKDANGTDSLFALGEKGIGAIYLQSAASLFSITDTANKLLGQVQSTGIYVQEDGAVGTVQQVDLVA